jgi:hypothetical protein
LRYQGFSRNAGPDTLVQTAWRASPKIRGPHRLPQGLLDAKFFDARGARVQVPLELDTVDRVELAVEIGM